jgi:hypothetical protein
VVIIQLIITLLLNEIIFLVLLLRNVILVIYVIVLVRCITIQVQRATTLILYVIPVQGVNKFALCVIQVLQVLILQIIDSLIVQLI